MSAYRIEKPCTIVSDGSAVKYRNTGAVIEIDDAVAAGLGDRVSRHGVTPEPEAVPPEAILTTTPEPEETPVPRRRPKPGGDDG